MRNLENRGAAVTGAASGIGRALALCLAAEGCRVAISDVNEEGLAETGRLVGGKGVPVDCQRVDVADRRAVHAWADRLAAEFGPLHLIFNNAAVLLNTTVEMASYEDLEWLMGVNFWGVVHGTKAFLPHLKKAGEGCVVNVSSIAGLVGVPRQAPYSASKFAVRGFTEALRQDLEIEGCGVTAISVHPGGVKTGIARSSRMGGEKVLGLDRDDIVDGFQRLARLSADRAARHIIRGVKRNRRRVLVGADAYVLDCIQRLFPAGHQRFMVRRARPGR